MTTVLCETAEYCVKPNDTVNIVQNDNPCHTIDHYISNNRRYFERDNIIITFLPGQHVSMQPLVIKNVENITIQVASDEKVYLQLVPTFSCQNVQCVYILQFYKVCCSVLEFSQVTHGSVSGLTVIASKEVSGILIKNSMHIQVHTNEVYSDENVDASGSAIVVFDSAHISIDNVKLKDMFVGSYILRTNSVNITNTDIKRCSFFGLMFDDSYNLNSINITVKDTNYSLDLSTVKNAILKQVYIKNNSYGLTLVWCDKTIMVNVVIQYTSLSSGIAIAYSNNTVMRSITSSDSSQSGIDATDCNWITLCDANLVGNGENGLNALLFNHVSVVNLNSSFNRNGVILSDSTTVDFVNLTARGNDDSSIMLRNCVNTILQCAIVETRGIIITNSQNTTIKDVTFGIDGILIQHCTHVKMTVSVDHAMQKIGFSFLYSTHIVLEECNFSNITSRTATRDMLAIITLSNAILVLKNCNFIENSISSIMASSSTIRVEGNVLFTNNSAVSGAAFIISDSSVLILPDNCSLIFQNNHASQYGGAFYIQTAEISDTSTYLFESVVDKTVIPFVTSRTKCFFQVEGTRSMTRLTFINNTAESGGDILYGGLVATGYDGDWNCLLSFKNISDMTTQSSEMPSRRISSDPSRVCICRDTKPDCLIVVDTKEHFIYPGQNITLSAAVVGQDFGIVQSQIVAKVFSSPNSSIPTEQKTMKYDKKGNCNDFTYTVYSRCTACKATLVLTPDYRRITKAMNVDDNRKLETSWFILLSEPNYNVLAIRYIKKYFYSGQDYLTFNKTYYAQNADNTIDNFFTMSPEVLPENGTNLRNKLRFPKEIYNYPLYNTIHFKPCRSVYYLAI